MHSGMCYNVRLKTHTEFRFFPQRIESNYLIFFIIDLVFFSVLGALNADESPKILLVPIKTKI